MSEVRKINGLDVKDAAARSEISSIRQLLRSAFVKNTYSFESRNFVRNPAGGGYLLETSIRVAQDMIGRVYRMTEASDFNLMEAEVTIGYGNTGYSNYYVIFVSEPFTGEIEYLKDIV